MLPTISCVVFAAVSVSGSGDMNDDGCDLVDTVGF